jgi:hypothetical protein
MLVRHFRYPLLHLALGALLLIRGIEPLLEAMPTLLPAADVSPWANGYAVGQFLETAIQLIGGASLLVLGIRESMATREKQQQPESALCTPVFLTPVFSN